MARQQPVAPPAEVGTRIRRMACQACGFIATARSPLALLEIAIDHGRQCPRNPREPPADMLQVIATLRERAKEEQT